MIMNNTWLYIYSLLNKSHSKGRDAIDAGEVFEVSSLEVETGPMEGTSNLVLVDDTLRQWKAVMTAFGPNTIHLVLQANQ